MPKNKQRKFSEINTFANVVQPGYRFPISDHPIKGQWRQNFFYNTNPVILEIGCGKGEYTTGMATAWPEKNFIGIDIKGNRIWTGAKYALENALNNTGFLRVQAEHLACFFERDEVSGIWITFPDPHPSKRRERKRLTSPRFLNMYRCFLAPGAPVFLKTDNKLLYQYTLRIIEQEGHSLAFATDDLYGKPPDMDPVILNIQTYYEQKFLEQGEKICFVQFTLKPLGI